MAGFVPRNRAESALRFLPQKVDWFEQFHTANHMLVIREFVDHMEKDDVLMHLVGALNRRRSVSGKTWADDTVKANAPRPMPESPVAALALRFDLLKQVKLEKLDLRYIAASYYPGEHLNERLMHWKRQVVHPLAEDLRRLSRLLLERLPEGDRFDMEELSGEVLDGVFEGESFGSRSWTEEDDKAVENKIALEKALASLEKAIEDAPKLSADERHDLALEAKIAAAEVRKGRVDKARKALDALAKKGIEAASEVKKRL